MKTIFLNKSVFLRYSQVVKHLLCMLSMLNIHTFLFPCSTFFWKAHCCLQWFIDFLPESTLNCAVLLRSDFKELNSADTDVHLSHVFLRCWYSNHAIFLKQKLTKKMAMIERLEICYRQNIFSKNSYRKQILSFLANVCLYDTTAIKKTRAFILKASWVWHSPHSTDEADLQQWVFRMAAECFYGQPFFARLAQLKATRYKELEQAHKKLARRAKRHAEREGRGARNGF